MAVGLLAAIVTIIGTIIVAIRRTGTWRKWCISFIVSVIIFSVGIENMSKQATSLGFATEQFRNKFNMAAEEFKSDLIIESIQIEYGKEVNTFKYMFTKSLGIIGSVNKSDGYVNELTILGHGDGTAISGLNIIVVIGTLIATVNPELSVAERGDLIRELRLAGDNANLSNYKGNAIRNNKKYWVNSSRELGIALGVMSASKK